MHIIMQWFRAMVLKLGQASEPSEGLRDAQLHPQTLIGDVWVGPVDFAFLTVSQGMVMLPVWGPQFE